MENETEITEQEAQQRITEAFETLDKIYQLHAPDQSTDEWRCSHCDAEWPCQTEKIILDGLRIT